MFSFGSSRPPGRMIVYARSDAADTAYTPSSPSFFSPIILPYTSVNLYPNESGRVTAVDEMTTRRGTFAATHAFAALTTPRLSTSWGLPPFLLPDAA